MTTIDNYRFSADRPIKNLEDDFEEDDNAEDVDFEEEEDGLEED